MIPINKNESPITPLSQEQLKLIIKDLNYNLYPNEKYEQFLEAYAKFYNIKFTQITAANGSDELIQKLMVIMPEGPVLTLNPDFFMYQAYAAQIKRSIQFVDASDDLRFDLQKILAKIDEVRPSFFIMSNPHNPTGNQFNLNFLKAISTRVKSIGSYFVIDEAYLDYGHTYQVALESHYYSYAHIVKSIWFSRFTLRRHCEA